MADALAELIKIANQVVFFISGIFRANAVTGVNGTLLGGLNTLTVAVGLVLTFVLVWKVMEAINHWVHDASGHVRPEDMLAIGKVVFFYALMVLLAPWGQISLAAGLKVDTGEFGGVSYSAVTSQIDSGAKSAIKAVRAVDTVMAYEEFLNEAADRRRNQIYEKLAESDPRMRSLWERRKARISPDSGTSQVKGGLLESARKLATVAGVVVDAAVNGKGSMKGMLEVIPTTIGNMAGYYFFMFLAWSAYFWFSWVVVKGVIIFSIYVKIATFLALILIPSAAGLSYFTSLRGFAVSMVRHLVVLLILANMMGAVYAAVFDQQQVKTAIAMGLKDSRFARNTAKEEPSSGELFAMRIGLQLQDLIPAEEATWLEKFSTTSVSNASRVAQSVMRVVAVLGVMVLFIAKLHEVINGALEGSFDASDVMRREAATVKT